MNLAAVEGHATAAALDATVGGGVESLRQLRRRMLDRTSKAGTPRDAALAIADVVRRYVHPAALFYFEQGESGLSVGLELHSAYDAAQARRFNQALLPACRAACRSGDIQFEVPAGADHVLVAAPVVHRAGKPDAFGAIFPASASPESLVLLVEMSASHMVLWHVLQDGWKAETEASETAGLVELLHKVATSPDLRHASCMLVNDLREHLGCHRVAIGLRRRGKGRCRLASISSVALFDMHSPSAHRLEAAMDEAILRDEMIVWPLAEDGPSHGALAYKNLCSLDDVHTAIGIPLRDDTSGAIGAVVVLDDKPEQLPSRAARFLQAAERPIAGLLGAIQRHEAGTVMRGFRAVRRCLRTWRGQIAASTVLLLCCSMAVPLPYKVGSDCRIEPVTRRFVAAPFEGTLERSLVKPGDIAEEGDVLAQLDGREVRWKRASVVANRNQAAKRRDSAMAAGKYAEAQIADLEMQRLDLELRLLDHRAENLEIRSPVSGIVAGGDLERAEGAPVVIGQTLFEIAPLQEMIVEIAVPDDEVSHVRRGQQVHVRLDAYPGKTWQAALTQVHPRSEVRDQNNVFVAKARLDNSDGLLRPGMKGRAKTITPRKALGWILFHRSWEYLTKKLMW